MAGAVPGRDFESVLSADGAHTESLQPQAKILWRAGRGSEVENVVHWAGVEGLADVPLIEAEARLVGQMGEVCGVSGGEIVNADYGMAFAQQAVSQVRTEKSGGPGNKYAHGQDFMLRSSGRYAAQWMEIVMG
jgi:hypothetical protein